MKKEGFLSSTYVYPSIWAIIIGIIGFISALIWQKFTGPDEVIVLNRNEEHRDNDTTITLIRFQPDEKYFQTLLKLSEVDIQTKYLTTKNRDAIKFNVDSVSTQIAREYQIKYDSLRLAIVKQEVNKPLSLNNLIPLYGTGSIPYFSNVKRPKFKMPPIVSGYTQGEINSYATAVMNSTSFKRKDKVELTLDFFDRKTIEKITPIFIDIVEPKSSNSVYFIWGDQYEIKEKKNQIVFSADFKPGKYVLTIGFYFLDEINTKYPPNYSKKFDIEIL